MDFPAFSSICSSNKAECGVNAGWMSVDFLLLLSVRMGNSVSLRRRRDKETKGRRVKKTKRGRVKESKRRRVKETKRQKVKETKSRRDKESKRRRDKKTKRRRDEGTKRGRDEKTKTASPPIHLLFVSCPLHLPIRSILIQFVSKNICEIRVQNSFTPENTVSWEVGKGGRRRQSGSGWHRKGEGTVRVGAKEEAAP